VIEHKQITTQPRHHRFEDSESSIHRDRRVNSRSAACENLSPNLGSDHLIAGRNTLL
jgi:hypothetical protein